MYIINQKGMLFLNSNLNLNLILNKLPSHEYLTKNMLIMIWKIVNKKIYILYYHTKNVSVLLKVKKNVFSAIIF